MQKTGQNNSCEKVYQPRELGQDRVVTLSLLFFDLTFLKFIICFLVLRHKSGIFKLNLSQNLGVLVNSIWDQMMPFLKVITKDGLQY